MIVRKPYLRVPITAILNETINLMIRTCFLVAVLCLAQSGFGQGKALLGTRAPAITFDHIINSTRPSASLSDYRGKVVVLDFWATWCGPCVASLPKLQSLQEKFGDAIRVVTISNEGQDRLERFLEKRPMTLPVVLDRDRVLAGHFPHRMIPHTVLIDGEGVIRVIANSSQISESVIRAVLDGKQVDVPEKRDAMDFDPSKPLSGDANATYQVTLRPYQEGLPGFSNPRGGEPYTGRRIIAVNLALKTLYEIAYQFPWTTRTVITSKDNSVFEWSRENAWCFEVIVPEALGEERFGIMREQLDLYFGYEAQVERRNSKVRVLKRIQGVPLGLKKSAPSAPASFSSSGNGVSMKNMNIRTIAEFLEERLRIPVVDETGLTEGYDAEIKWYNEDPMQIVDELRAIGLELVNAEREVEFLVIADRNR